MSMIAYFYRVTNEKLATYLQDSRLLDNDISAEDVERHDPDLIEIDKSWDCILYLLTGNTLDSLELADPLLASVIIGKQVIDEDQDMGYGPANYNDPAQVEEIAAVLTERPGTTLKVVFDPFKMTELELYPGRWDDPGAWEFIETCYEQLRRFYAIAAKNQQAVITFVS
jgi:Domain of unknown function (DUF1877)